MVACCVTEPEGGSDPDQLVPLAPPPMAVQPVAPVDDQVKVKEEPLLTETALLLRLALSVPTVRAA